MMSLAVKCLKLFYRVIRFNYRKIKTLAKSKLAQKKGDKKSLIKMGPEPNKLELQSSEEQDLKLNNEGEIIMPIELQQQNIIDGQSTINIIKKDIELENDSEKSPEEFVDGKSTIHNNFKKYIKFEAKSEKTPEKKIHDTFTPKSERFVDVKMNLNAPLGNKVALAEQNEGILKILF